MSRNPFSSSWLAGGDDERLRPPGSGSYVAGPTDGSLHHMTVPQLLDRAVARHGSREALVCAAGRRRWSWYDLQRDSDDLAAGLLALGLRRGNRVALWAGNRGDALQLVFATARIGAVLVPIDPAWPAAELERRLNQMRCRVLVLGRGQGDEDGLAALRTLAPELDRAGGGPGLECLRLPHLEHVLVLDDRHGARAPVPPRAMRFADLAGIAGPAQRARLPGLSAATEPDDAFAVLMTRGTTGPAKAVTLTHYNVVNTARHTAKAMHFGPVDRLALPVPLHRAFGLVLGALACVSSGATLVLTGEAFDAATTLDVLERERCTALHGAPAVFEALLALPGLRERDLSSMRSGLLAGAACPAATLHRIVDGLHLPELTVGYGVTEASPLAFQTTIGDDVERRATTVGRLHPHLQAKVIDQAGRILPLGSVGQLCLRGYPVMRGYWEDEAATRAAIDASGWLRTGDLVSLDAEGRCRFAGKITPKAAP